MDVAEDRPALAQWPGPSASARFDPKWLVIGACVVAVLYLALVPLVFLLWQSFHTPESAAAAAPILSY